VDAVSFRVGAFTNLSQDHLDYHHTMEEYWSVKRGWFTSGSISTPVVDIDDVFGAGLAVDTGAEWTVGLGETARVRGTGIRLSSTSCRFVLEAEGGSREVILPLAGEFNVSNALVAAGCALALDVDLGSVAKGLAEAPQVPGRLERVDRGQPFAVLVDYAHTPDGLEKAILAVRDVVPGRVITVFGCGGDRDQEKRPTMGEVASKLSDVAVITSDNPRSEDPVGIILQIEDGARRGSADIVVEVDRRHAISVALQRARPGDAVLIAGKGHEDYQIFADRTIHFDDRQVAAEELEALC
jgi:UDP-N-acetylmuramoyl-L-alanyl-D-glutamate--2,6-diaminopimelate ligase